MTVQPPEAVSELMGPAPGDQPVSGGSVDIDVDGRTGPSRRRTAARCVVAGICLAGSVPPWGWWPLAFVGIVLLDRLLADRPWPSRFRRSWLVAAAWLYPAMLWMFDLTGPGYVAAGALYAAYFGLAGALTPAEGPGRRLVLPGAFALAEVSRWSWPFGGVPLAHLGLSQVETPIVFAARIGGPLLVVVSVVVLGQALSALLQGERRPVAIGAAVVLVLVGAGMAHPRSEPLREIDVALVQGGGAQRTRASSDQQPVVLGRHLEASRAIEGPVDLIVWPENVVNPGRFLDETDAFDFVADLAAANDAPVLAGWFLPISDTNTANYQSVITPGGVETDRYDKVRLVPFGEYVPLRGIIEQVAGDGVPLPSRDVQVGTVEPVLDTELGPIGVAISWEGFFEHRSRHAVREGAQLLTNPTNGSSFWLTQVQTQQVASNQLRAIENDRWVLQVAPTGLSAVIDPEGQLLQRTNVSERAVLQATVEMLDGRTLASRVGWWPVVLYGLGAIGVSLGRRLFGARTSS